MIPDNDPPLVDSKSQTIDDLLDCDNTDNILGDVVPIQPKPIAQVGNDLYARVPVYQVVTILGTYKGLIPRALFLGEMRIISPVSFELRLLE